MFTLFQNFAELCLKNYPFFLMSPIRAYLWKITPFFAKVCTNVVYVLIGSGTKPLPEPVVTYQWIGPTLVQIAIIHLSITQTQDIFSLADSAWKHPKYPCFCILPPEFEVNIDIHKHENSEVIYSNHNKFPKEMSGDSRLQKKPWKTC